MPESILGRYALIPGTQQIDMNGDLDVMIVPTDLIDRVPLTSYDTFIARTTLPEDYYEELG